MTQRFTDARLPAMSTKKHNQMTVSGEWAKHLRPFGRRAFWKGERHAFRVALRMSINASRVKRQFEVA